jgi:predicted DNA-binding transcriptional regulator AlpA
MKWVRQKEVAEKLSLSLSGLKALMVREPAFPKPVKLSERHIVWDEDALNQWMKDKFVTGLELTDENLGDA